MYCKARLLLYVQVDLINIWTGFISVRFEGFALGYRGDQALLLFLLKIVSLLVRTFIIFGDVPLIVELYMLRSTPVASCKDLEETETLRI